MGKHEAQKPSWLAKLGIRIEEKLQERQVSFRFEKPKKHAFRPLWGFLFTSAFALVSVVDPYSGTIASAEPLVFTGEEYLPEQTYGFATTQTISFARGGFNIVTGDEITAMFVAVADDPEPGTAKAYAFDYLQEQGFKGPEQYSCLVKLWERESNWRWNAKNKSSGAYGIPQSLPGTKMASEGADWLTNPETQIRWGVKYIKGRYGSPCGALAHSDRIGWY